jgi:hypothetical protein
MISWVHFGDLHIQNAADENFVDFTNLIDEVNQYLASEIDFAFLPGDNADDGLEDQYRLVHSAISKLAVPVQCIAGDHDRKQGSLALFKNYLAPQPYRAIRLREFLLLFLNALDGPSPKDFDLSSEQFSWLTNQLNEARRTRLRPLVFTHLYPSELRTFGEPFTRLIHDFPVELVEMGHTHYNELANDGQTIYAATRSTGQIEEGPPGFSITVIDDTVISWKFKPRDAWPLVMITSPADRALITRPGSPAHVVRGTIPIRAKVFGQCQGAVASLSIDNGPAQPMEFNSGIWQYNWNSASVSDGIHQIAIRLHNNHASDEILVLVNQAGLYSPPARSPIDYENTIGAYLSKGILGTQLGPNENGTKGPWPSWRK